MEDLIIIGAGGSGVELISLVRDINQKIPRWNVLGFLDDNPKLHSNIISNFKVLGSIDDCNKYPSAYFISSIAHPKERYLRKNIYLKVLNCSLRFATLIHPSVIIFNDVEINEGTIVKANCVLGANSKIGRNAFLSNGTIISHEVIIKDHATLATGVRISSGVVVGEGSYLGCGVSTAHDIYIDSDVVVGVGAAVTKNIDNRISDTWVGVPAKPIIPKN